jgi:hypothetical protein
MNKKFWTDSERSLMREMYPNARTPDLARMLNRSIGQVYQQAAALGLKKSQEYLLSPAACRLRRGDHVGKESRFKAGQKAWNKGMKGLDIGGKETRFSPGQMPYNHVPVGTIVADTEGYLKKKVAEPRSWRYLHRLIWEEAHGPIPRGMPLIFKDGNRQNCSLENLMLVSRSQLMNRNTIHNYPAEIKNVMQIRAGLVRRINDKRRKNGNQSEHDNNPA